MSEFHLEHFKPEHFFKVDGREGKPTEAEEWMVRQFYDRSFYGNGARSAFTAFDGNRVIGCAGVMIMWRMGEVWMHVSEEVVSRRIWFHRTAFRELERVKEQAGLSRVQTAIPIQNEVNRRWIKRLGFRADGPAKNYGPNQETCMRYVWVKETN